MFCVQVCARFVGFWFSFVTIRPIRLVFKKRRCYRGLSFTFSISSMVPKLPVNIGLAVLFLFSLMAAVTAQNWTGPTNISEFNLVRVGTKLYSVAGSNIRFELWSIDISQAITLANANWTDLSVPVNGSTFLAPYNEGVAFPANDGISFFSGAGNDGTADDTSSLVEYNSQTDTWSIPYLWGKEPAPRKQHAAEPTSDGEVWFFGGEGIDFQNPSNPPTYFNQFYRLFTTTNKYDVPALETTAEPAARYQHTMTAVGDRLFVLGGISCYQNITSGDWQLFTASFGEALVFDTVFLRWESADTSGDIPASRTGHSAVAAPDGQSVVVYGGLLTVNNRTVTGDVYVLDTCNMVWTNQLVSGNAIAPRTAHAAIRLGNQMLIMNGLGNLNGSEIFLNDAGIIDLVQWAWVYNYTPPTDLINGWSVNPNPNCTYVFPSSSFNSSTNSSSAVGPAQSSNSSGGSSLFGLFALLALAGIPAYVFYRRRKRSRTPVAYWVPGATSHELGTYPPGRGAGGAEGAAASTGNADYPLFVYTPRPNTMARSSGPASAPSASPFRDEPDLDADEPVQDGVATQRHKRVWDQVRGLSQPGSDGWNYDDDAPLTGKTNNKGWARLE
ncbi:hypothetical protein BC937DRAFT_90434 [Endogone sp. FLAS-F59071]|nr:hypothetical protein BC937DRAFT_90434 [Endogone sp. FLAS-F59071]|eukprot:RUS17092.1 hypothetical protein BC937DRAFT_90434 [Endogone sp. FLAS-F59071]